MRRPAFRLPGLHAGGTTAVRFAPTRPFASQSCLLPLMLKTFLHGLFRRPLPKTEPDDEPALDPLTVMAVDTQPRAVDLIDVDNLFFPWLLGQDAPAAQDINETEAGVLRALKRAADEDDAATADLVPRMPSVIPVLLRSLRDSQISNRQLAAQVTQDPVLLAAVLRQVNSSYYRRATPIRTIEEAIAVLGLNGLRMLVARVAFKPLFNADLGRFTRLGAPRMWELAEPCAVACAHLAQRRHVDSFEAYLAGLLRNVGVIVALRVTDQAGAVADGALRSLAFHASFIHYTRRLARLVGRHWEFPIAALAADSQASQADPELAHVLYLADRTGKIRVLVRHGALREEHAEACLENDEIAGCYREILAAEATQD